MKSKKISPLKKNSYYLDFFKNYLFFIQLFLNQESINLKKFKFNHI